LKIFTKSVEVKLERTMPANAAAVFDAWLNPKIPGNPWNEAEKVVLNPTVDGLFYWTLRGIGHYGRFTEVSRPSKIVNTWVSPNTAGEESLVTVSFRQDGENTVMTLVHSNLPDTQNGRSHQQGWTYFLDKFLKEFQS